MIFLILITIAGIYIYLSPTAVKPEVEFYTDPFEPEEFYIVLRGVIKLNDCMVEQAGYSILVTYRYKLGYTKQQEVVASRNYAVYLVSEIRYAEFLGFMEGDDYVIIRARAQTKPIIVILTDVFGRQVNSTIYPAGLKWRIYDVSGKDVTYDIIFGNPIERSVFTIEAEGNATIQVGDEEFYGYAKVKVDKSTDFSIYAGGMQVALGKIRISQGKLLFIATIVFVLFIVTVAFFIAKKKLLSGGGE